MPDSESGMSFGKYTLIERIGVGGMAEVFKAEFQGPEGFSKTVALKLMIGDFSERDDHVRMFIEEAKLVAGLEHGNIVRVYEFGKVDDRYYISMELVRGVNLSYIWNKGVLSGRLFSVPEALSIALEACKGLECAHGELAKGSPVIIHRDISPQNIMVSESGEVKIADFGIAKLASSPSVTESGILKGKTAYVSPEQVRGLHLDTRSDIFSLGVVLWEILTGKRLFTGASQYEILEKLVHGDIDPPSKASPSAGEGTGGDLDSDLDRVVLKMLSRDREARYDSVSVIIEDLTRILIRITAEDRNQVIRRMYREIIGEDPGRFTKESRHGPGRGQDSIPIDVGVMESGSGESVAEVTAPDRPSNIREAEQGQGNKQENSKSAIRLKPKLTPAWKLAIVLYFLVTVIFIVYKAISREGLPDSKVADTVSPGVSGAPAVSADSGHATKPVPATISPGLKGDQEQEPVESKKAITEKVSSDPIDSEVPKSKTKARDGKRRGKHHSGAATRAGVDSSKQSVGKITVESIPPGAKVYLGENYLGRDPLREIAVPVGRHLLKLEDDSGHSRHKWINVRKGKTNSYVMLMGDGK